VVPRPRELDEDQAERAAMLRGLDVLASIFTQSAPWGWPAALCKYHHEGAKRGSSGASILVDNLCPSLSLVIGPRIIPVCTVDLLLEHGQNRKIGCRR